MFRIDIDVFSLFCTSLVEHGFRSTRHMEIKEMVGMFLHTLGHGVGNKII